MDVEDLQNTGAVLTNFLFSSPFLLHAYIQFDLFLFLTLSVSGHVFVFATGLWEYGKSCVIEFRSELEFSL